MMNLGEKLFLIAFCFCAIEASHQRYGNDFVTYSIGDRYQRGDFMIKNVTVESVYSFYYWPKPHRLEYKINNHDDLLSFAQIDIVDTDDPHQLQIRTTPTCYEILIESTKKFWGVVRVYHKAPENFVHINQLLPAVPNFWNLQNFDKMKPTRPNYDYGNQQ